MTVTGLLEVRSRKLILKWIHRYVDEKGKVSSEGARRSWGDLEASPLIGNSWYPGSKRHERREAMGMAGY
jgi:hypothetical protein